MSSLETRRRALSSYAAALNEVRIPLGRSLHWALGRCIQLDGLPKAPLPEGVDASLSPEQLVGILDAAQTLAGAWGPVARGDDFLWRDLTDPEASLRHQAELSQTLSALGHQLVELQRHGAIEAADLGLSPPRSLADVDSLHKIEQHLAGHPPVPDHWLTAESLISVQRRATDLQVETTRILEWRAELQRSAPAWEQLAVEVGSELTSAVQALSNASPPLSTPADEGLDATIARDRFLQACGARVRALHDETVAIAEQFGLSPTNLRIATSQNLADAALLASAPAAPRGLLV